MEYYTTESQSHWTTIPDVTSETFTIENLQPSTTLYLLIRARNAHGLSPPSPISKALVTPPDDREENLKDPRLIRKRLSEGRVVRLGRDGGMTEEEVAGGHGGLTVLGPRKVRLEWEVR